jgi:hypothetical protein
MDPDEIANAEVEDETGEPDDELEGELKALGSWSSKSLPAFELKLDGAKEGDIELAFAQIGVRDKDGHVTDAGAFPSKSVPMSAYGHTSWPERGARLPTGLVDIGEEGKLAKARGRFFLETTHGRDTYLTVKALGDLQEWSYGYKVLDGAKGKDEHGKPALHLKKLDVREVSPVLVGAGLGTHTIGIKSSDDEGPLAGLPYADAIARVLRDAEDIVGRSKSLRELRVKEGRELSTANREKLSKLRDSIAALDELRQEVEDLLSRTDPSAAKDSPEVIRLFMEYERTRAGLAGVPMPVLGGTS